MSAGQLCDDLIDWAVERGANCIVTVCPLCQANLDLLSMNRKRNGNGAQRRIPIMYFTQLIALALGSTPEEVGLKHGLVPVEIEAPRLSNAMVGTSHAHGEEA